MQLLIPETIKFLGTGKKDVDESEEGKNIPKLESVELILVHCNLVKYGYQHTWKVLFTLIQNKQFGELIKISPHSLIMMNTIHTPDFPLIKFAFQTKLVKHLKLEIMSTWQFLLVSPYKNEIFNATEI